MADISKLRVSLRNTGGDDNICEVLTDDECGDCKGCLEGREYFEISIFNDFFTVSYHKEINDIIIGRHSERVKNSDFISEMTK